MVRLTDIEVSDNNVAVINEKIIPALAGVIPAGTNALELYAKKQVDEKKVVRLVVDLYVDLYRVDMTGPIIEACDAVLRRFEESIKIWASEKAKGLVTRGDFREERVWQILCKEGILTANDAGPDHAYFSATIKDESELRERLKGVFDEDRAAIDDTIRAWRQCPSYGELVEALVAPVRTRRLQLANVETALRLKWAQSSYRPPHRWKSVTDVMTDLAWLKELKEGGLDPQITWQQFYDFLMGYERADPPRVYVKGGSLFGDGANGGLLYDLDDRFKESERAGLLPIWDELKDKIGDFNDEDRWDYPTGYKDLGDKLNKLYEHMQRWRRVFEAFLLPLRPDVASLEQKIGTLEGRVTRLEKPEEAGGSYGPDTPLTEKLGLKYVGARRIEALAKAGIMTLGQLAQAKPADIRKALGVSPQIAQEIREQARQKIGK